MTPAELRRRRYSDIHGEPARTIEASLLHLHPSGVADRTTAAGGGFFLERPGREAPTTRWLCYLAACEGLVALDPIDPTRAAYVTAAAEVLAWRAAVPPHLRFWEEGP